jgi:hypothetical protein
MLKRKVRTCTEYGSHSLLRVKEDKGKKQTSYFPRVGRVKWKRKGRKLYVSPANKNRITAVSCDTNTCMWIIKHLSAYKWES